MKPSVRTCLFGTYTPYELNVELIRAIDHMVENIRDSSPGLRLARSGVPQSLPEQKLKTGDLDIDHVQEVVSFISLYGDEDIPDLILVRGATDEFRHHVFYMGEHIGPVTCAAKLTDKIEIDI